MTAPDWSTFPHIGLTADRVHYRVHRAINDPINFANSGDGRFDLIGLGDRGTCYMAASALGAYVETFGRLSAITDDDIAERSLTELVLLRPLILANLTSRAVLGDYGIAGDVSAGTNYGLSQEVAARLHEANFDGIYYTARHDPAFLERSIAVFGDESEAKLFAQNTEPIPDRLIADAEHQFNLIVLPGPHFA